MDYERMPKGEDLEALEKLRDEPVLDVELLNELAFIALERLLGEEQES